MKWLLKGANVYREKAFSRRDILLDDGVVIDISPDLPDTMGDRVFFLPGIHLAPGFAEVHAHLREPGYAHKETIATGTAAAARGGYTLVCAMPNVNPAPDSPEALAVQRELIREQAAVPVLPYGCITRGRGGKELCDMRAMAGQVAGFSDDGSGVQNEEMMRRAMRSARAAGAVIAAHVEDESLLHGGVMHDGAFAAKTGYPGICAESEWGQLLRDLRLVAETGARYHMCHVSCKESVVLLRWAKARGLPVSAEVAPHYLVLCDEDLRDEGRFKMNPPIRAKEDREALLEGLLDGAIDVIATDHAPHTDEEKQGGFGKSAMGVVGLETAFAVLYTKLVQPGRMTLETLVEKMSARPRQILGLADNGIRVGEPLDAVALDLEGEYSIDPAKFASMGKSTPFAGWRVRGRALVTWAGGRLVYTAPEVEEQ